jgi:hypothetical protein
MIQIRADHVGRDQKNVRTFAAARALKRSYPGSWLDKLTPLVRWRLLLFATTGQCATGNGRASCQPQKIATIHQNTPS